MAKLAQYKSKILNEFENKTTQWTYGNFEQRLGEIKKNAHYQDAKSIILEAHDTGLYPKTVKQYVLSNYKVNKEYMSSEFNGIFRGLLPNLTVAEKNFWILNSTIFKTFF